MKHDVIIIGAGAAGLSAARELVNAGIKPLLIEARERIGGRVDTHFSGPVPVELGAEFIHGMPPETFDIVKEADLETREVVWTPWQFTAEGKLAPGGRGGSRGEASINSKLNEFYDAGSPDVSLNEFLNGGDFPAEARTAYTGYVGGFHAAEIDKIGVQSLVTTERAADDIDGHRAFRLPGGYREVIERIWAEAERGGAQLELNTKVKRIKWMRGHVEITVVDGIGAEMVFQSARLIITLPVGVLKAASSVQAAVIFDPVLEIKNEALERIEMGAALRVVLHFKNKWWAKKLDSIGPGAGPLGSLYAPGEVLPVWWTNEPSETALLTGWAGGAKALALSELDRNELRDKALESLARIFSISRDEIDEQLLSVNYHNWHSDPFALGSYSYMAVGGLDVVKTFSESIEDTLFFAGEATSFEGHWGTVHGALASGQRVAKEIL